MSRPLRSAPITGASALLRAGPPARAATVLSTSPFQRLGALPLVLPRRSSIDARLPMFPHASRRPGSRHLHAGHRLASNAGFRQAHPGTGINAPVLMPSSTLDASAVVHSRSPSRSPPDSSLLPFPHRSARQSSANAPCGGLTPPPQGGAEGPQTFILRAASTSSHRLLQRRLLSAHTAQNAAELRVGLHRSGRMQTAMMAGVASAGHTG
jgi:hypothetical protein